MVDNLNHSVSWDSAYTSGRAGGRVASVDGIPWDQGGSDLLQRDAPDWFGRITGTQTALNNGATPQEVIAQQIANPPAPPPPTQPAQQSMSAGLAPYAGAGSQMQAQPNFVDSEQAIHRAGWSGTDVNDPVLDQMVQRGQIGGAQLQALRGRSGAYQGMAARPSAPIGAQQPQYAGPQMPQMPRAPYQPMGGGYQSFGMGGYQMPSYNSNPFLNQAYTTMQGGFQVPSFLGGPMGGLSQILGPAINAMAYAPWTQQQQSPYQSGYSAYGRQQGGYPQQQPYQQQPYNPYSSGYGGGYPQQPYNSYQSYGGYGGYGMPSYDVGTYNVKGDQVAQLHGGEAVIPTEVAQPMRDMGIIPQDGPVSKGVGTMPVAGPGIGAPMDPTSIAQTLTAGTPNDLPPLPNPASKESSINPMAYGLAPYAKPAPATNAWDQTTSTAAAPTYDMAAKQAAVDAQRSAASASGVTAVGGGASNPWGNTPYGPTQTSDPTQAYTSALPAPHQINPQQWMNLDPDTQQFLLGAYAAAGYSPNNVQWTIGQLLPGQTSAGANPWGRIGA